MVNKPSYEEMEQRVKELEKESIRRKKAEEALRESEERYRIAVEYSNDGVAIVKGEIHLYVNKKLVDILGYERPEDIVGKPVSIFVHPDDRKRVANFNSLRQQGKPAPSRYECKGMRKDGEHIYLSVSATKTIYRGEPVSLVFLRDITKRIQIKKALEESEERFKQVAENAEEWIWEVDAHGLYTYASPVVEKILGYKPEELVGQKHFYDLFHPEDKERVKKAALEVFAKKKSFREYINRNIHKNSNTVWISTSGVPVLDREGNLVRYRGADTNITNRKQAEEALRESEAQKRAILDASIDRLRYVDKDMRVIWANKTTAMELDMSPEDLVGQTCYKLFIDRDTPCEGCPTVRARETGKIERAVMHQPTEKWIEGESYWDNYSVPLKNEAGDIVSFIQVARNITDQKRADEHIHTLTQQLMKAQESERQMISRELHDSVGQDLSTLKIGLDTLIANQSGMLPETRQRVSELSKILRDSVMAIRDLSNDLRPPSLDQLGMVRTIFQYCEDFSEKTGLSVDFTSAGMDDLRLDFDTEINLYRLIQEGLNNIRKHADANLAKIRLVLSSPNIILRIEDDGKGFDVKNRLVAAQNEKRMGLRSMKERASLLKGAMRIQSHPGKGTKILIEVPYEEKKSEL